MVRSVGRRWIRSQTRLGQYLQKQKVKSYLDVTSIEKKSIQKQQKDHCLA